MVIANEPSASVLETATRAPFGTEFAAKMSIAWYRNGAWSPVEVRGTEPLTLHPGAHVLHYSSSCFEGLKAYRSPAGGIHIFRLDQHVERMLRSAELICLPVPNAAMLEGMIISVVDACRDEVPDYPSSLYLRPVLFGTELNIGAAATSSQEACLFVMASPVGDYFDGGARPLKLLIEDREMRSPPGFGQVKTGGNYAAALRRIVDARRQYGTDQVLFCPGGDVQETGAANFLLIRDGEILTKGLEDGSFLPGITRRSLLELAPTLGYRVSERDFTVDELLSWIGTGEAALSGTAAVMAGVGTVVHRGREIQVGDGGIGPHTARLRQALTAIQSGEAPDPFGWRRPI